MHFIYIQYAVEYAGGSVNIKINDLKRTQQ